MPGNRLTEATGDNMLKRFLQYAAAFEEAYESRDFSILEPFFTEAAVYEIRRPGHDPMEYRGRTTVLRFLSWVTASFDRRFADRRVVPLGPPRVEASRVEVHGAAIYTLEEGVHCHWTMTETAFFEGGRIARLLDVASPGAVLEMQLIVEGHPELFPVSVIEGPSPEELTG